MGQDCRLEVFVGRAGEATLQGPVPTLRERFMQFRPEHIHYTKQVERKKGDRQDFEDFRLNLAAWSWRAEFLSQPHEPQFSQV